MDARIVMVSPAMAARWLENPSENRNLRVRIVDRYVRDMKAGKWQLNGSTIVISPTGQVLDGQHRLHACIKAGVPFKTLLCEGVAEDAFKTIDSGIGRNPADVFALMGVKYSNTFASAVTLLYRYDLDNQVGNGQPTHEEALAIAAKWPELSRWVDASIKGKKVLAAATLAFVACAGARIFDDDTSELFVDAVAEGVNLTRQNPARVLREKLLATRGSRGTAMFTRVQVLAYTIKAYSAFAHDESISVLKWMKAEPFPRIVKRRVRAVA